MSHCAHSFDEPLEEFPSSPAAIFHRVAPKEITKGPTK